MLLVTGATGNSGSHLMRELETAGYASPIRCLVRSESNVSYLQESPLRPEIRRGDLTDHDFLVQAFSGVETIMHIASIKFSIGILRAAVKSQVRRVILVHTTGVYSRYKSAAEEYTHIERGISEILAAENSSIEVVILRPTMIFGQPRDRNMSVFIRMVDRFKVIPLIGKGESLLQPVHGRDLGRAFMQVILSQRLPANDYILSGERPVSMREMLSIIARFLDQRVYFVSIPLPLGVMAARGVRLLSLGKIDAVERVQRMGEDRSFPHDAAVRDFNYAPALFTESLQKEVDIYNENRGIR